MKRVESSVPRLVGFGRFDAIGPLSVAARESKVIDHVRFRESGAPYVVLRQPFAGRAWAGGIGRTPFHPGKRTRQLDAQPVAAGGIIADKCAA